MGDAINDAAAEAEYLQGNQAQIQDLVARLVSETIHNRADDPQRFMLEYLKRMAREPSPSSQAQLELEAQLGEMRRQTALQDEQLARNREQLNKAERAATQMREAKEIAEKQLAQVPKGNADRASTANRASAMVDVAVETANAFACPRHENEKQAAIDERSARLLCVDRSIVTQKGHITGLIDERDVDSLVESLYENAQSPEPEPGKVKEFRAKDRRTWTKENLLKLAKDHSVKELTKLQQFTTPAWENRSKKIAMPIYTFPLTKMDLPDPFQLHLFPMDKSECTSGSTERIELCLSAKAFGTGTGKNALAQMKELEGVLINVVSWQQKLNDAKAHFDELRAKATTSHNPTASKEAKDTLKAAEDQVKEAEVALDRAKKSRRQRSRERGLTVVTALEMSIDVQFQGSPPEYYTLHGSPISSVTLDTSVRTLAGIPEKALFYCYAYPILQDVNLPALEDRHESASFEVKAVADGNDPEVLEVDICSENGSHDRIRVVAQVHGRTVAQSGVEANDLYAGVKGKLVSIEPFVGGKITYRRDSGEEETFANPALVSVNGERPWDPTCRFVQLLTVGGFVYFDHKYDVMGINSLRCGVLQDGEHGNDTDGPAKLYFGPGVPLPPTCIRPIRDARRWQDVTSPGLKEYGFTLYCWVQPSEFLGGFIYPPHGGYAFHHVNVEESRFFPVVARDAKDNDDKTAMQPTEYNSILQINAEITDTTKNRDPNGAAGSHPAQVKKSYPNRFFVDDDAVVLMQHEKASQAAAGLEGILGRGHSFLDKYKKELLTKVKVETDPKELEQTAPAKTRKNSDADKKLQELIRLRSSEGASPDEAWLAAWQKTRRPDVNIDDLFDEFDEDKGGTLSYDEVVGDSIKGPEIFKRLGFEVDSQEVSCLIGKQMPKVAERRKSIVGDEEEVGIDRSEFKDLISQFTGRALDEETSLLAMREEVYRAVVGDILQHKDNGLTTTDFADETDIDNVNYVLFGKAVQGEVKSNAANGQLATRDEGRSGEPTLVDFFQMSEAKQCELTIDEVAALRLYTTSTFNLINKPLRSKVQPHPLAITTLHLSTGLKKLRGLNFRQGSAAFRPCYLWRGMKNLATSDQFMVQGGSELGVMSTTKDTHVATGYGASQKPLLFRIKVNSPMDMGAEVNWLSAFPRESEVIYPPLSMIQPLFKQKFKAQGMPQGDVITATVSFPS